jgi:peroxiredoxin
MKWRSIPESGPYHDLRPLREIFAERKKAISDYVPPDIQAVHQRTITTLKAESFATMALAMHTTLPPFELPDHNGERVSSAALLSKGRLVLCFIRGRWCPFCVGQMEAMNYIAAQIVAANASIVAISPQTEKQAFFMHDQHKLTFPLLVDAHNALARQFGLVYKVPEEQQKLYRSTFVNLPFINGRDAHENDSWELPIPATYIVDRDGSILFASADEDYTERPEPLDLLSILEHSA